MAVFGASVFGVRLGDQVVGDRSWSHRGASECRVHRSSGLAGLRERVSSVVGGIVIAIVVELLLATVVPPSRLIGSSSPDQRSPVSQYDVNASDPVLRPEDS
jgi:hypothetical protein